MVPGWDPHQAISSNEGIYERFQILNIGVQKPGTKKYLRLLASWDPPFGKFHDNQYPIQIWEPQDQPTIKYFAEQYNSVDIEKPLHFSTN